MAKRKIIKIDQEKCTGCGACAVKCAEGAIEMRNGKAVVVKDSFCDGLGACIGECPVDALHIIEREAEDFDEEAVKEHLKQREEKDAKPMACGCPSSQARSLEPKKHTKQNTGASKQDSGDCRLESTLENWPVQLKLIMPEAPYLKGADVAIIADCVAYAYAMAHEDFMKGKKVIIGCPKLDEKEPYVEKLAQMIKSNNFKSLTLVHMEVPCCFGFKRILDEAIARAGMKMPYKEIVVGIHGEIKG